MLFGLMNKLDVYAIKIRLSTKMKTPAHLPLSQNHGDYVPGSPRFSILLQAMKSGLGHRNEART